jgi:hypothetical protein
MINISKPAIFGIFLMFQLLTSCRNEVTITRSYIYSKSWAKGGYQGFEIAKIHLNDTTISILNKNFNRYLLDQFSVDSSFCFGSSVNMANKTKASEVSKIFFDEESKYYQWYSCWNITETKKRIGLLKLNTWYIVTGLSGTEDFYVYIDKDGGSHSYSLGPKNW